VPEDPGPREVHRALEDRELASLVDIGIRRFHREHAVVAAHARIEQDRTPALEAQLVAREEACPLVVEAMLAAAHARGVAETVEEREALAMLEHTRRLARARRGREDVPTVLDADGLFGKLDRLHAAAARGSAPCAGAAMRLR